jgi:LAO/AO transport system kinase
MEQQAQDILNGERRALARAITLVESTRKDHRKKARALLQTLSGANRQALRIGLSGTPGVGKSTFTEAFGMMLIELGLKVAVLAVDPSSTISGGSILGDKTRMEHLSREKNAFIRPSPSQTALGGVTRRTRESIALCEAAGFDIILVETVGVGQSETMVADMTDIFLLLLAPAGGDELQGVKRGIMEIADIILVNKADGDLKAQAMRTCADYSGALQLMRNRPHDPEGFPKAMTVSSIENNGLEVAWAEITALSDWRKNTGVFDDRRKNQALIWFQSEIENGLVALMKDNSDISAAWKALENNVRSGKTPPDIAAQQVLALFEK